MGMELEGVDKKTKEEIERLIRLSTPENMLYLEKREPALYALIKWFESDEPVKEPEGRQVMLKVMMNV